MNPYIPNTPQDVAEMLSAIGADSIDDLFRDITPGYAPRSFSISEGMSEWDVTRYVRDLAGQNACGLIPFVGGGYYDHWIPPVIQSLISRGEFLTAYTPYQPECAQGTLQALYEYQSSICALTGMEVSNASLYDGGTALYEAMMMALRVNGRPRVIMDGGVSPIFRTMIRSYTRNLSVEFFEVEPCRAESGREKILGGINEKTSAVILQNPDFFGRVDDLTDIIERAHARGALVIQSVYPVALGMIKTPGEMGADIVTGEGQSLGLPLSFGGPGLGFMAVKKALMRKMPGRIVGETVDAQGRRCFVNTLQAREQHIRREKATSNICTNAALCAVQAGMYMALMGRRGIQELAWLNFDKAQYLKARLAEIPGVDVQGAPTFNEFTVSFESDAADVVARMIDHGFAAGFPLGRYYPQMKKSLVIAVTEKRTRQEMDRYADSLREVVSDLKTRV